MDVTVCVKQIPGPEVTPAIDEANGRLVRSHPFVLDEADNHGVELALQLAEASGGGAVTAISMVPGFETEGLRPALAMGADNANIVSDDALVGADALTTAKVLAAVIRRLGATVVVAGTESSDGYTGTVPVQCAELLGWPALSFAKAVAWRDGFVVADRQVEDGTEQLSCAPPLVIAVTAGAVQPRYPTLRGVMGARQKPVEQLSLVDLGLAADDITSASARQHVVSVARIEARQAGRLYRDDGQAHQVILDQLVEWRVL